MQEIKLRLSEFPEHWWERLAQRQAKRKSALIAPDTSQKTENIVRIFFESLLHHLFNSCWTRYRTFYERQWISISPLLERECSKKISLELSQPKEASSASRFDLFIPEMTPDSVIRIDPNPGMIGQDENQADSIDLEAKLKATIETSTEISESEKVSESSFFSMGIEEAVTEIPGVSSQMIEQNEGQTDLDLEAEFKITVTTNSEISELEKAPEPSLLPIKIEEAMLEIPALSSSIDDGDPRMIGQNESQADLETRLNVSIETNTEISESEKASESSFFLMEEAMPETLTLSSCIDGGEDPPIEALRQEIIQMRSDYQKIYAETKEKDEALYQLQQRVNQQGLLIEKGFLENQEQQRQKEKMALELVQAQQKILRLREKLQAFATLQADYEILKTRCTELEEGQFQEDVLQTTKEKTFQQLEQKCYRLDRTRSTLEKEVFELRNRAEYIDKERKKAEQREQQLRIKLSQNEGIAIQDHDEQTFQRHQLENLLEIHAQREEELIQRELRCQTIEEENKELQKKITALTERTFWQEEAPLTAVSSKPTPFIKPLPPRKNKISKV